MIETVKDILESNIPAGGSLEKWVIDQLQEAERLSLEQIESAREKGAGDAPLWKTGAWQGYTLKMYIQDVLIKSIRSDPSASPFQDFTAKNNQLILENEDSHFHCYKIQGEGPVRGMLESSTLWNKQTLPKIVRHNTELLKTSGETAEEASLQQALLFAEPVARVPKFVICYAVDNEKRLTNIFFSFPVGLSQSGRVSDFLFTRNVWAMSSTEQVLAPERQSSLIPDLPDFTDLPDDIIIIPARREQQPKEEKK